MSRTDQILREAKEAPMGDRAYRDKIAAAVKQKYGLEIKDWGYETLPGYGECIKLTLGTPQAPLIDFYIKDNGEGKPLSYINMEINLSSRAPNPAGVVSSFPKY